MYGLMYMYVQKLRTACDTSQLVSQAGLPGSLLALLVQTHYLWVILSRWDGPKICTLASLAGAAVVTRRLEGLATSTTVRRGLTLALHPQPVCRKIVLDIRANRREPRDCHRVCIPVLYFKQ